MSIVKTLYYKFSKKDEDNRLKRNPFSEELETFLYYALKNINLKEIDQKDKDELYKIYLVDKEDKNVNEDEVNKIHDKNEEKKKKLLNDGTRISLDNFNDLITLINDKVINTGILNPGDTVKQIYEQLAYIALNLYQDEGLIIEHSLSNEEKNLSKDQYIYDVIKEIVESIDKDSVKVTPEYAKKSLSFIYTKYMSIIPVDVLKETIVQMAVVKDDYNNSDLNKEDNLNLIFNFYQYLLSRFNGDQITLDELNGIGENLKQLNDEELNLVINCFNNLVFKDFDEQEANVLVEQINRISQLESDDLKQIERKIRIGNPNTTQLETMLNKIAPQKRRIIGPKVFEEHKKLFIGGGIATALVAVIVAMNIAHKASTSNETSVKNININVENMDNTNLENIIGEDDDEKEDESYNLYYPVLYKEIDYNGEIIEKPAYVCANRNSKQLEDKNIIFVAEENKDNR